jgi:hypothetical protein
VRVASCTCGRDVGTGSPLRVSTNWTKSGWIDSVKTSSMTLGLASSTAPSAGLARSK